MGSNPVEAPKAFFGLNCDCLNRKHNCDDHTFIFKEYYVFSELAYSEWFSLVHQLGRRFYGLEHQYGRRDVM